MDQDPFGDQSGKPRNDFILQESIHLYLSTMERPVRSNLTKLLFVDDESDVSSTNCEDPANKNQIQSQDELTNPHRSQAIDIRMTTYKSKTVIVLL